MRNDPAPNKYTGNGYSPLHSCVLCLYDSMDNMYHNVGIDNLYNSAYFPVSSFGYPKKVVTHSVTRKGSHDILK